MIKSVATSKFVYGYLPHHETFAFADDETAAAEAQEIMAIATARTFGEARQVKARHISYNPADSEYESGADREDDEHFDIKEVDSVIEGDWPPMVASRALDLLPKDIQQEYGTTGDTTLNGDFLEIRESVEQEIVAALRGRGYQVRRDDELVNTLDGATLRS